MSHPSSGKNKIIIAGVLAFVVAIGVMTFLSYSSKQPVQDPSSVTAETNANDGITTVSDKWEWQGFSDEQRKPPVAKPKAPIDSDERVSAELHVGEIYEALQEVKLDEFENVVIDHDALTSLYEAMSYGKLYFDEETLADLDEVIKIGLPGKAGEQVAEVVINFYHYLEAQKNFDQEYGELQSINEYQNKYKELVALRESYLGPEVASKLFVQEDANAMYMLESFEVEESTDLTAEEKQQKTKALADKYFTTKPDIVNWDSRYATFTRDKQAILNAGLTQEEQEAQVNALMQQHFNASELRQIESLQLNKL